MSSASTGALWREDSPTDDELITVAWHDLECGTYGADFSFWLRLANRHSGPILDVGAGTGRVTLALARAGHEVWALDRDPALLGELRRRATGLPVEAVLGDARDFDFGERRFGLIIVPMQTLQLLGGASQHRRFFAAARSALAAGGAIAVAVVLPEAFEPFEWEPGDPLPLPDIAEHDGRTFISQPTAVRREDGSESEGKRYALLRRRELVEPDGRMSRSDDRIELDVVSVDALARTAAVAGLHLMSVDGIDATDEHIGSEVVIFGG